MAITDAELQQFTRDLRVRLTIDGVNIAQDQLQKLILKFAKGKTSIADLVREMDNIARSAKKLESVNKAFKNIGTTAKVLKTTLGGLHSQIVKLGSLVGAGFGLDHGLKLIQDYNKEVRQLSALTVRLGMDTKGFEKMVKDVGAATHLTLGETRQLFKAYERGVRVVSSGGFDKAMKRITSIVGPNAEAVQDMMGSYTEITQLLPDMQGNLENISDANKEIIKQNLKWQLIEGKIGDQLYRNMMAYVEGGEGGKKDDRASELDKQQKAIQDIKKAYEDVGLAIGQAMIEPLQIVSKWLQSHKGVIEEVVKKIGKVAEFIGNNPKTSMAAYGAYKMAPSIMSGIGAAAGGSGPMAGLIASASKLGVVLGSLAIIGMSVYTVWKDIATNGSPVKVFKEWMKAEEDVKNGIARTASAGYKMVSSAEKAYGGKTDEASKLKLERAHLINKKAGLAGKADPGALGRYWNAVKEGVGLGGGPEKSEEEKNIDKRLAEISEKLNPENSEKAAAAAGTALGKAITSKTSGGKGGAGATGESPEGKTAIDDIIQLKNQAKMFEELKSAAVGRYQTEFTLMQRNGELDKSQFDEKLNGVLKIIDSESNINQSILAKLRTEKDETDILLKQAKTKEEIDKYSSLSSTKEKAIENAQKKVNDLMLERKNIIMESTKAYDMQVQLASAQVSKMSNLVSLMDNFATGVGATVQMKMQLNETIQAQINAEQKSLEILNDRIAKNPQDVEALTQKEQKEGNILQLQTQQASNLKSLRDGWISAIGAMNTGAGAFTKIMFSQTKGMGAALQTAKGTMIVSSMSGKIGGGGYDRSESFSGMSQGQMVGGGHGANPAYETSIAGPNPADLMRYTRTGGFQAMSNFMQGRASLATSGNGGAYGLGGPSGSRSGAANQASGFQGQLPGRPAGGGSRGDAPFLYGGAATSTPNAVPSAAGGAEAHGVTGQNVNANVDVTVKLSNPDQVARQISEQLARILVDPFKAAFESNGWLLKSIVGSGSGSSVGAGGGGIRGGNRT